MTEAALRLAVIGAGPRGISVLERLSANYAWLSARPVEVHLIDPAPAGGGRIWRHDQPTHLLMNTLCADATHWTDDTVECEGPIVTGPTLYQWCQLINDGDLNCDDDEVVDEAATVAPHSHPSRRLMGAYLRWCHLRDVAMLPAGLSLVTHPVAAVACEPAEGGALRIELADGKSLEVEAAVLATGHADTVAQGAEQTLSKHAAATGAWYGQPANPLDQDLTPIAASEPLIMRGLGMNFFDYVSLLTVGRGGSFVEESGVLRYRRSGAEPVMYVGSGRGTPYRAKGVFGQMTPHFPPTHLTAEVINALARGREQVDFLADLWPRIAADTARVYYQVLHDHSPESVNGLDALLAAIDSLPWGDAGLAAAIRLAVPDPAKRMDLTAWDRPLGGLRFAEAQSFTHWWINDLRHDLTEAQRGLSSAYKCASVALGQGRAALRQLVRYGGIRGGSYDRDVDRWYRGFAGSLASGPPATRIRELIALAEAGLVKPVGPGMRVEPTADAFVAYSPQVDGSRVEARALLEAHLPPASLVATADPLLAQLRDSGQVRGWTIPDQREGGFSTGAIEVGPPPYRVVSSIGIENPRLYGFGVPVEGLHFGTQLGPLAQTNSRFLRDADAIARAMLDSSNVS